MSKTRVVGVNCSVRVSVAVGTIDVTPVEGKTTAGGVELVA